MITWTGAVWAISTAYVVGARAVNAGGVYRASVGGTSSGSGPGPTSTVVNTPITDGSVTWYYLGANGGETIDFAPELSTIVAAIQWAILDAVDRRVSDEIWAGYADDARRYLAAHLATITKMRGRGPITAESLGAASRSYASLIGFGPMGLTAYGVQFLGLLRLMPQSLGAVF